MNTSDTTSIIISAAIVIVVLLILALFILVGIISYNRRVLKYQTELRQKEQEKQEELLDASIEAQEIERNRIGGDIHDDIGPLLSTIKLYIYKFKFCKDKAAIELQIQDINSQVDEIIQRVRDVARDMAPSVLLNFGLIAAIQNLCDRINTAGEIKTKFHADVSKTTLQPKIELALYRITQELCNNTIKHAEASELSIHITQSPQLLELTISDNGKGIPQHKIDNTEKQGFGIQNIYARTSLIKAKFTINGIPQQGTKAVISLPL